MSRFRATRALPAAALTLAFAAGCSSGTTTTATDGTGAASSTPAAGSGSTTSTAAAAPVTFAPGGDIVLKVVKTPFGDAIGIDGGAADDRVVYTWDKEADAGAVTCTAAACVEKWPPVFAAAVSAGSGVTAKVSVIERPDGTTQAAIDGKALYLMKEDAPGEANCQGTEGWWIVNADGTKNDRTTTDTKGADPKTSTPSTAATSTTASSRY